MTDFFTSSHGNLVQDFEGFISEEYDTALTADGEIFKSTIPSRQLHALLYSWSFTEKCVSDPNSITAVQSYITVRQHWSVSPW